MATILGDAISRAVTFDISGEDVNPIYKKLKRELGRKCNVGYPNTTLAPVDEVQTASAGDRTGGTMDLTIELADGQTFDVETLAYNATATVTQAAVDAAAIAAGITGYIAGDIVVTGGPFGSGGSNTIFTFSGDSVRGDVALTTVDGGSLTGGSTDPAFAETIAGVVPRFWFAALLALGVLKAGGSDPAFGVAPAGQYEVNTCNDVENYPSRETIIQLLKEADAQEGQDWTTEILGLIAAA